MKLILIVLVLLFHQQAYCIDTQIKGFIALDAFNFKQIVDKEKSIDVGIGVLDLKVFAEQDNLLAAIKLNIDGNLSVQNNLFEEAYVSYRGFKNYKLTLGKGVVKFQNLHFGVVQNTYQDGGTVLSTENSWRKLGSKALASLTYGGRQTGLSNTFTLWGDSQEIQLDEEGNPKYVTTGGASNKYYVSGYQMKSVSAFTTQKQLGLANKLELYKEDAWTFTTGQVYFKNKFQSKPSYAFDLGLNYESETWEFWIDTLYGFTSKAPFEAYSTYKKNEFFIQGGVQYHLNDNWSVLANTEFLHVTDQSFKYTDFTIGKYTYTADYSIDKDGQTVDSTNYKVDFGAQYRLTKSSFVTCGVLYEKKESIKDSISDLNYIKGVYNPNSESYQFLTSVSFWF